MFSDDAERFEGDLFAERVRLVVEHGGRRRGACGLVEEELDARKHTGQLVARLGDGLAGLVREDHRQLVAAIVDQPMELAHDRDAVSE